MKILADQVKNSAEQTIENNDKIYDWRGDFSDYRLPIFFEKLTDVARRAKYISRILNF